ncbi:iron-containing alcohol dehydrogenase [Candidatus Zixiibacteriota bacterium]
MPTKVIFGSGAVEHTGPEASQLGRAALVVTGKASSKRSGALDRAVASLQKSDLKVEVFDQVEENPTDLTTERGAELARAKKIDVIVALGGGSPMDAAKGIAILVSLGGRLEDYYGAAKVSAPVLPVLVLPTTAGTGSEVTPYAVFTDSREEMKKSVASPAIFPRTALLDPQLTASMPPEVTANTGIDALTHALEGFTSVKAGPISDTLALEAIALIQRHLPVAVERGDELEARAWILHASMLAGMVIAQTGTTLIHGMGYAPTTAYGIPHGLANGILMPQVVAFNGQEQGERYARLAAALGQKGDASSGTKLAVESLRRLLDDVKMPTRLRDVDVTEEDLEKFARQAMKHTRNLANNARRVSYEEALQIYRDSY